MIPALVVGTVLSLRVEEDGALPRTRVLLQTADGEVELLLPGSNGPPVRVGGVPLLEIGQTWQVELERGPLGLVPVGLGAGMSRLDGPPSPPWALNGLRYAEDQLPLVMFLNEAGSADLGLPATEALVQRALRDWNAVGCSGFRFEYGGRTEIGFEDDGVNVLTWQDEGAWAWGTAVAGFAATRFEVTEDGGVRPVGADLLFNGVEWTWQEAPGNPSQWTLDAGSIVLHELGHVTGMDHELGRATSTMYYAYLGGDGQGSLAGDDRRGLCENYGTGAHECESDADCAAIPGAGPRCVELDGLRVCEELRDPPGAPCSTLAFNCEDYCLFPNRIATEGVCAAACAADADCPEGSICEPGRNFFPDRETVEEWMCQEGSRPGDTGDGGATDGGTSDGGGATDAGGWDGGGAEEPRGCGCRAGSGQGAALWAIVSAVLFRRRPRRPR